MEGVPLPFFLARSAWMRPQTSALLGGGILGEEGPSSRRITRWSDGFVAYSNRASLGVKTSNIVYWENVRTRIVLDSSTLPRKLKLCTWGFLEYTCDNVYENLYNEVHERLEDAWSRRHSIECWKTNDLYVSSPTRVSVTAVFYPECYMSPESSRRRL